LRDSPIVPTPFRGSWERCTAGASANFSFSIDVPDLVEGVPTAFNDRSGYAFTLTQQPTIPEPCTLLLLGSGLTDIVVFRKRRHPRKANDSAAPFDMDALLLGQRRTPRPFNEWDQRKS
jgi:hypothetical protein